jgi:tetratricopeptide (TPR) repeat protein
MGIGLCVVLALCAAPAHAQIDTARARVVFQQAAKAYHTADYERAIKLFRRAYQLDPRPELIYNVGQAYEKLGNVPEALRWFRQYLRLAPDAKDGATVQAGIASLERRLGARGVQQVTILSRPLGATVIVDGKRVGEAPWTGELKPGRHRAVLKLDGHPDTTRDFLLPPQHAIDLDVALLDPRSTDSKPTTTAAARTRRGSTKVAPAHDRGSSGLSRVHPWTWAALGAGVAGLGAALGFELARHSAERDARSAPDQIAYQADYYSMKSRQTTARVLLGVGGALTVTGGVLLYLDLTPASSSSAEVGMGCATRWCGMSARGRF